MNIITISELRKNCHSIINKIENSKQQILISKKGKTIAKIIPTSTSHPDDSWIGCLTSTGKILGDITAPIHDVTEWEVLKS